MRFAKDLLKVVPLLLLLISQVAFVSAALSPLANASITVDGDNGEAIIISGSDGNFLITQGLGTGNYKVEIYRQGYISKTLNTTITAGSQTNLGDIELQASGKIQGVVKNPSGNAVSNISVVCIDESNNHTVGYALASSDGSFTFDTDIKTGSYTVEAVIFGVSGLSYPGLASNRTTAIKTTAGQTTSGVILQLRPSGAITGTVKDKINAPIANVSLFASGSEGTFGGFATTNTQGIYTMNSNLPTGTYKVYIFDAKGFVYSFMTDYKNANVIAGQTTTVDFSLDRSAIISGTVTLTSGPPAPNVTVSAFRQDYQYFGSAQTNSNGLYRIDSGLATGQYQVSAGDFMNMKTVNVTAGVETPNVNFQITKNLAWIAGTVKNSTGGPIDSADVHAESLQLSESSHTDDDGKYNMEIDLLLGQNSAQVNVTASAKGYLSSSKMVTISSGQTTSSVDYTLQRVPSGTLKGRIVAAYVRADAALSIQSSSGNIGKSSSVTISGALTPARPGTVTIYQSVNGSGFAALTTATLSNGQYSLAVTPSSLGAYQFRANWPGDDLYNPADSSTTSVTVSAQPTLTATITATPTSIYSGGTSTIRVTLTSQASAVTGATVSLASDKGGTFSTVTDSGNGTYTSTYTAPDINAQTTITVTATASKTGYAGSSAQTQITAQLLVLNITIKGSDGSSIDGATVASTSQPSGQTALNKTTDVNGLVSFTGILKGSYTFKATKTGYDDKTWTVTVQAGQVTTETATLLKPSASPGIPGFPYESIVLGLIAGIIVVWLLQRKH